MINIRRGVFETNSSSSHSLSLTFNDVDDLKCLTGKLTLSDGGVLNIVGEDFTGIEFEISGAKSKADLIATYIVVHDDKKLKERFESVLKKRTGATNIHYDIRFFAQDGLPANTFYFPDIEDTYWYNDEGDEFIFADILKSKKRLETFIFDEDAMLDAGEHSC
jgi:hypothetical protein